MRRLLTMALLPIAAAGCYTGQGSGAVAFQSYDVTDFSRLALIGAGEVLVLPGDFAVLASAEDNVLPSLIVRADGATLFIGREVDWIDGVRPTVPIRYTIYMPMLDAVSVSGSGKVAVHGLRLVRAELSISGSGALDLVDCEAEQLVVTIDGSGMLKVSAVTVESLSVALRGSARAVVAGRAGDLQLTTRGSALYRGVDLRARQADVDIGGAAQAFVWADEVLRARVHGAGRLGHGGGAAVEETLQRDGASFPLGLSAAVEAGS